MKWKVNSSTRECEADNKRKISIYNKWFLFLIVIMLSFPTLEVSLRAEGFKDYNSIRSAAYRDMNHAAFSNKFNTMKNLGYRVYNFEAYRRGNKTLYSGIWIKKPDNRKSYFRRNLNAKQFGDEWKKQKKAGMRLVDFEAYKNGNQTGYAGLWIKNKENYQWSSRRDLTHETYSKEFKEYKKKGYQLIDVEAYGIGKKLYYAAVWVKIPNAPKWASWRNLSDSQFKAKFKEWKGKGYRVLDFESYRHKAKQYYAVIFVKNTNNRGWAEYRDMTEKGWEKKWDEMKHKGYRLIDFASYPTGKGFRYAGVWRQNTNSTVNKAMFNVIKNLNGHVSFYAKNIKTNKSVSFFENDKRYLASVTKVAVMAELYRRVAGGLKITTKKKFTEGFYREEGKRLKHKHIGNSYSLDKYCEYMIDNSDTTSTDILVNYLGESNINNTLQNRLGLKGFGKITSIVKLDRNIYGRRDKRFNTVAAHKFEDWLRNSSDEEFYKLGFKPNMKKSKDKAYKEYYATKWNSASAKDLAKLIEKMARKTLWNASVSQKMLDKLRLNGNPNYGQKISGDKSGYKSGGKYQVKTEAGYIGDSSGKPIIAIAILMRNLPDRNADSVKEAFKNLGKAIYDKLN